VIPRRTAKGPSDVGMPVARRRKKLLDGFVCGDAQREAASIAAVTCTLFDTIPPIKLRGRKGIEVNEVAKDNGMIQIVSDYSVEETVRRLEAAFAAKGLQVFAVVDHGGEAEKVGMTMRPTKVVIFGSPKAGTPLMVAAPSLAIDLPLKALVAEDAEGKVSVTYNSPEYLKQRHSVPEELIRNLEGAGVVIGKAVE